MGENKPGNVTGENNFTPYPGYASRSDVIKSAGNGEEMQDTHKKKDVFRPTVLDMESGRRDRWHDEEIDTNSSVCRDRWREGDKELGNTRKVDRWMDNSSARHFEEVHRVPFEQWADLSNRETNHGHHRESKWSTRWGPNDNQTDSLRENLMDSGRDADMPIEKGLSDLTPHARKRGRGTIFGHGDQMLTIEVEWNLLITELQYQANRALHLRMVEDVGKMLYQPFCMGVEGLALVEAL